LVRLARDLLKLLLYRTRALAAYHQVRNRRALTVAMFHRVLAASDPRAAAADWTWTVSDEFFQDCLRFFVKHYHVVAIQDLLESLEGRVELPERPLLITFDDGWADTEDYAAPLLRKMNLPSVVFVIAEAVGGREPWSETVRRLWRAKETRPLLQESVRAAMDFERPFESPFERPFESSDTSQGLGALIDSLSRLDPQVRRVLADTLRERSTVRDEMLSRDQLARLRSMGCAVGSHGLTHTSISVAPDPWTELQDSRQALHRMLADGAHSPRVFSFPNGRYDAESIRLAGEAGYSCVFTSDGHLNSIPQEPSRPLVFGRIDIGLAYAGRDGRLREELLAARLFLRPIVSAGPVLRERVTCKDA
jgi:peptidoglycan/xylan/chitin deacetylase (PgdA/CDA1 family)